MKPIIFQEDNVFKAFKNKGEIATYRTGELPSDQEFWVKRARAGPKVGEADLFKAVRISKDNIYRLQKSFGEMPTGFTHAHEWYDRIIEMHGHIKDGWILYLNARWIE